ncbi:MAG TPA: SDR family oxidoreductase [Acidimicrobiia bacterium]|jgi:3-oxoacyl-[acyl-carrier protein] reductase
MTARALDTIGRLDRRVALVTGGSSGIGQAISTRLAAAGATVAVVASASRPKAQGVTNIIRAGGGIAHAFIADVADPNDVRRLVDEVGSTLGPPSIAINSAGVWFETPLAELDDARVDQLVDVNLKGTISVTAAVSPHMVDAGFGSIVNIASAAGILPSPRYSVYAATKAAVIMFTKAAALELAPLGVAINAIAPGNTTTPMNEQIRTHSDHAARRDWIEHTTPSRRAFTPPDEIANVALMLVDGRARGFHGATLAIDEGRTAGVIS